VGRLEQCSSSRYSLTTFTHSLYLLSSSNEFTKYSYSFYVLIFFFTFLHQTQYRTRIKFQIIGFWLLSFENSFPNTENSICYENYQNDYTQLIVLFEMFLISIKCCYVMYNRIEKKGAKDQLFETLQYFSK
jgi:hypothetical protein